MSGACIPVERFILLFALQRQCVFLICSKVKIDGIRDFSIAKTESSIA